MFPDEFIDELKKAGWKDIFRAVEFQKGEWKILFDTSSRMIVENKSNPRVFDVHVPNKYESRWTVDLVEHLCRMEDERCRLRTALDQISNSSASAIVRKEIAEKALKECYHTWIVKSPLPENESTVYFCPICGSEKSTRGAA